MSCLYNYRCKLHPEIVNPGGGNPIIHQITKQESYGNRCWSLIGLYQTIIRIKWMRGLIMAIIPVRFGLVYLEDEEEIIAIPVTMVLSTLHLCKKSGHQEASRIHCGGREKKEKRMVYNLCSGDLMENNVILKTDDY
mmetsp:Transcript_31929/g.47127  ORF Transcript_31929/g.47127 Transcript_31929/m.47127 type:complete len:137 (+) Transcript_31929:660-1070(+)